MPAFGATSAGFVVMPLATILQGMQQQAWQTIDPALDLSASTPDGQMLAIVAAQAGSAWELLQIAYNQYNREDTEGAGLDNVGDLTGTPRAGASYTQVYCDVTVTTGGAPYAPGALLASVVGSPTFTFSNVPATAPYATRLRLILTLSGNRAVTLPASVVLIGGGAQILTSGVTYCLDLLTVDAGTTWYAIATYRSDTTPSFWP